MSRVPASTAKLAERTDADLGADLLARLEVHAPVGRDTLRLWASAALAFGAELADRVPPPAEEPGALPVQLMSGGVRPGRILLAEFRSRPAAVRVYTDAIEAAERLIDELGWRTLFPSGSVRAAALAHEQAHAALHGPVRRQLRRAIGHEGLRLGRWRIPAHVLGADELAAHGFAQVRAGLGRSPVLLTAALAELAAATTPEEVHRWAS